jgi:tRNA(Ile)-lysidine synthase
MTLLDAVAKTRHARAHVIVATFDHGTGVAARRAVQHVRREARARGLRARVGKARLPHGSEALWRSARLAFLRAVAAEERATLVTGHSRDDQLETIVMRVLRGAGVRGLAGLLPAAGVARPLLGHTRAQIRRYAEEQEIEWVDDPSNTSRGHLRNRIRLDLLPAILAVRPSFEQEMHRLAQDAFAVRAGLDAVAAQLAPEPSPTGGIRVDIGVFESIDDFASRLLWQAIAATVGITPDWRGTVALSRLSRHGRTGGRCRLSGRLEAVRERDAVVLRQAKDRGQPDRVRLFDEAIFDVWRFRRQPEATIRKWPAGRLPADPWIAALPARAELSVRSWAPGDRMSANGGERRVKRYFADARIVGPHRAGWPVVLVGDSIVWIPGVRRSPQVDAVVPGSSIIYRCERQSG